jgi:beta-lactamase class A
MSLHLTRRTLLQSLLFFKIAEGGADRLGELERRSRGRLGVAILETGQGTRLTHRANERFPMCSTFKLLAAAAVLARVDRRQDSLERRIPFTKADLLEYAPVTTPRVGEGAMPLGELCDAAITMSDNTAANLMLATFGGPGGLTSFARSIGDSVTRLDRTEPTLNQATPGDPRDTTSPSAMLNTMKRLLLGDALSPASRERLIAWLVATKTGNARVRAGVPAGWRVGDKTGTGNHGSTNDLAIIFPPGRPPILVAAYLTETNADASNRETILADVGRLASNTPMSL